MSRTAQTESDLVIFDLPSKGQARIRRLVIFAGLVLWSLALAIAAAAFWPAEFASEVANVFNGTEEQTQIKILGAILLLLLLFLSWTLTEFGHLWKGTPWSARLDFPEIEVRSGGLKIRTVRIALDHIAAIEICEGLTPAMFKLRLHLYPSGQILIAVGREIELEIIKARLELEMKKTRIKGFS